MSSVLPSSLTDRQPRYHAPFVAGTATGATKVSCNRWSGSQPMRVRACDIPDFPVTLSGDEGP